MMAGINYLKPVRKWLDAEVAIQYSRHWLTARSAPMPGQYSWDVNASLITVPVMMRFNFLRYFYGMGGLIFNADLSKPEFDSQTGVGVTIGLGAKYDFRNGVSVFLNPYFNHNGLVTFGSADFSGLERLLESGVRLGFMMPLNHQDAP
ncbi:hypothetical protein LL912_14980 [Niabella sp. CC-SYL272]|uniref:hypothetical protein n=1 Tax=Niabella agricola TaxID=2891571 RepID=UPI001F168A7C|nr:hypothetical protein [Niabella agricola]MCF3110084.1 hypothetical protein [Niabella agricola]